MKHYDNAAQLIQAIQQSYMLFIEEFAVIPESLAHQHIAEVTPSPAEMLAYQLGWIRLLLSWKKIAL